MYKLNPMSLLTKQTFVYSSYKIFLSINPINIQAYLYCVVHFSERSILPDKCYSFKSKAIGRYHVNGTRNNNFIHNIDTNIIEVYRHFDQCFVLLMHVF